MAPSISNKANHDMPPPPRPEIQKTIDDNPRETASLSLASVMSQGNAQILFQPKELSVHLDHLQNASHSASVGTPSAFQLKLKEFKSSPGIPPHMRSNLTSSLNPSQRVVTKGHGPNDHWSAYEAYLAKTYGTPIDGPTTAEPGADLSTIHKEQVLSYIYSWVEWASRIKDVTRRAEVMNFIKEALERALKHGIEIRAFKPEDVHGIKKGVSGKVKIEISVQATASLIEQEKTVNVIPSAEKLNATQEATMKSTNGTKRDAAVAGVEQSDEEPASKKQKTDVKKDVPGASEVAKAGDPEQTEMKADSQQKPTKGVASQTPEPVANAGDGQQQSSPEGDHGDGESDGEVLSPEEEAKRDRYLQQIFRPRFNIVMKMAGRALSRGKCSDWHTCRKRLEDAGVDLKRRNMFMRDFVDGYKKWNEVAKGDPNLEIAEYLKERHAKLHQRAVEEREAAIGSGGKKGPKVTPAQLAVVPMPSVLTRVSTDETGRRLLSIRTYPGFDPVDYTHYAVLEYRNFIFEYKIQSTAKERFCLGERLCYLVDTTLASKGWYYFKFGQVEVRNEQDKAIAVGMFVERKPDINYSDEDLRRPDEVAPPLLIEQFTNPALSTEEHGDDLEDQRPSSSDVHAEDLDDDDFDALENAIEGK